MSDIIILLNVTKYFEYYKQYYFLNKFNNKIVKGIVIQRQVESKLYNKLAVTNHFNQYSNLVQGKLCSIIYYCNLTIILSNGNNVYNITLYDNFKVISQYCIASRNSNFNSNGELLLIENTNLLAFSNYNNCYNSIYSISKGSDNQYSFDKIYDFNNKFKFSSDFHFSTCIIKIKESNSNYQLACAMGDKGIRLLNIIKESNSTEVLVLKNIDCNFYCKHLIYQSSIIYASSLFNAYLIHIDNFERRNYLSSDEMIALVYDSNNTIAIARIYLFDGLLFILTNNSQIFIYFPEYSLIPIRIISCYSCTINQEAKLYLERYILYDQLFVVLLSLIDNLYSVSVISLDDILTKEVINYQDFDFD